MGIAVLTEPALEHVGYTRAGDMPEKLRLVYDEVVAKLSAKGFTVRSEGAPVVIPTLRSCITLNGSEFSSCEAMPPRQRLLFEAALAAALPLENAICAIVEAQRFYRRVAMRALLLTFALEVIVAAFLWTRGYFT